MSREDVNRIGSAGEAAVAAALIEAGCHVFVPAFGSPDVDMIVDVHGSLLRLQVKTLAVPGPALRFPAWGPDRRSGYSGKADWLAFHSLYYGVTAFLKPEEIGQYPTLRYDTEEDRVMGNPSIRYARDYPMERMIKEAST